MTTAASISLGAIALVAGWLLKAILDWPNIGPAAQPKQRSTALFRHAYFAPDLVMLSLGLLISSHGIEALLSSRGVASRMGPTFGTWFVGLLMCYVIAMLLCIIFWFAGGSHKYIPVIPERQACRLPNGQRSHRIVQVPMWVEGICSSAGVLCLVIGNAMGLACVSAYALFASVAF